ncbi:hypothetical protein [Levilactobacillus wangkuiensis]|uniref:hypothetical protein n=1 Tax=Levilactobacillus wangkuiensis TaxID=2799566 RepID=UPI0019427951|nr:hypothetical protein [Levilactobacillus wangkuiensis]
MKISVKQLWVLGIVVGTMMSGTTATAAALPMGAHYSQQRANSVKLVWRRSMTRKAYHPTEVAGARYSKHLGIRYQATLDTLTHYTFFTDAHEKVRVKATGKSRIYYHVKTSDGLFGGWVWRGYLKAGVTPGLGNAGQAPTLKGKLDLTSATSTAKFDRDVVAYEQKLRPNFKFKAKANQLSQLEAQNYLNRDADSLTAIQKIDVGTSHMNGSMAYITVSDFNQRLSRGTSYTSQVKNMAEVFDDLLSSWQASPQVGIGFYTLPDNQLTGKAPTDYRAFYAVSYEDDNE